MDDQAFSDGLLSVEELAEDVHTNLVQLVEGGKNLPVLGSEDHQALKAARDYSAALVQLVVLIRTRVGLGVSNG